MEEAPKIRPLLLSVGPYLKLRIGGEPVGVGRSLEFFVITHTLSQPSFGNLRSDI